MNFRGGLAASGNRSRSGVASGLGLLLPLDRRPGNDAAALIVRDWHQILDYKVTDFGRCLICGTPLPGRYEAFTGQFGRKRVPVRISAFR